MDNFTLANIIGLAAPVIFGVGALVTGVWMWRASRRGDL